MPGVFFISLIVRLDMRGSALHPVRALFEGLSPHPLTLVFFPCRKEKIRIRGGISRKV